MRIIHRLSASVFLILSMFAASSYAQQGELAQDCDGQVSRQPPYVSLSCSGWFIRLYTPSGKKWGRVDGKSREDVLQQVERGRKLDEKAFPTLQSNPNHSSYDYPSEPICEMCDARAARAKPPWSAFCSNPSIADAANVRKSYLCTGAVSEVEDWGKRVARTLPGLLGKLEGPNPFGNLFSVIGPYLSSLADAMRRVNDLRDKLKSATDWTEIDRGLNELRDDIDRSEKEYNRLPSDVRAWLENRASLEGVWSDPTGNAPLILLQKGDRIQIHDNSELIFDGKLDGNVISVPAARRPFIVHPSEMQRCGLSTNKFNANTGYRITFSPDWKYFTVEELVDKFVAGQCEFGGVRDMGKWHKIYQ